MAVIFEQIEHKCEEYERKWTEIKALCRKYHIVRRLDSRVGVCTVPRPDQTETRRTEIRFFFWTVIGIFRVRYSLGPVGPEFIFFIKKIFFILFKYIFIN